MLVRSLIVFGSKPSCHLEEMAGNDEVTSAIALYSQWQDNLLGLFHQASHGQTIVAS